MIGLHACLRFPRKFVKKKIIMDTDLNHPGSSHAWVYYRVSNELLSNPQESLKLTSHSIIGDELHAFSLV